MKKILLFAAAALLWQGVAMAQKPIAEKDVKVSYVKDFQRQVKDATDVQWFLLDSMTFKVEYLDNEKSPMAMIFSNKGMETHYFVELKYCPQYIKDTVSNLYPRHSVTRLWVRKVRNKMTYQARIARKSGFLWWKKEGDVKVINFEVDGKYIGEE